MSSDYTRTLYQRCKQHDLSRSGGPLLAVDSSRRASVRRPAAGDVEDGASRKGTVLRGEPTDEGGDLVDFHEPSHRNLAPHVFDVFRFHLREDLGVSGRGCDAVDQ